jgi:predicted alpha-1,6-mannanase (GH76 family)
MTDHAVPRDRHDPDPHDPQDHRDWTGLADIAQRSIDTLFRTAPPQVYETSHPHQERSDACASEPFMYWWLAHLIDCRVDAFVRTGERRWSDAAQEVRDHIQRGNGGSLVNDYFDDMLWLVLALIRLDRTARAASEPTDGALEDAVLLYEHVVERGWNDLLGPSLSWREQQPDYKNSPANGPLIIASLRLADLLPARQEFFLAYAHRAMAWWEDTLVGADGFVEDGINREGDGRIDTQWAFTYNQGLYIGARVEWWRRTGDREQLDRAVACARTAIVRLSDGDVFRKEGAGGDEGLFKGIFYRYLGLLCDALADLPDVDGEPGRTRAELEGFVRRGTDVLARTALRADGTVLRAGGDWSVAEAGPIHLSTELSAVMAVELRAHLETRAA